uniref:Uncharacterized protein n=1 Tax=Ascaris lumbricoides TaxID=6252 RepID=A0A0M3IID0_ASCLU
MGLVDYKNLHLTNHIQRAVTCTSHSFSLNSSSSSGNTNSSSERLTAPS